MELRIEPYKAPEQILFNYEELKTELLRKASLYESLVYTEDKIKEAKEDRANLNRLKKALNDERIKREREYLQPFSTFKGQISEIISIIDKPCAAIDKQIKAFEEQKKEDKQKKIEAYWHELLQADKIPAGVCFKHIFTDKWLNASVSMKFIQGAIDAKVEQLEKDLAVIENLPSYAFEARQMYLSTLDLAKAVSEAHRLQEMAEKKAAYEAEREKQIPPPDFANLKPGDKVSFAGATETAEDIRPEVPAEPVREWIGFQAFLSVDEAKMLGAWLREHGIKYKAV